jgi:hypothetical protein
LAFAFYGKNDRSLPINLASRSRAAKGCDWRGLLARKQMEMKKAKKRWIKPAMKDVPIFFECTCYAGAI